MPKDLADDKTVFAPVVRVPVDGDDATGAVFELPYQQLANRTAFLNEETIAQGVRRIRQAASFASLAAVTGMQPFDVRSVPGQGLYWYDATATDPEDLPWAVRPTVGGGLWRHIDAARRPRAERAYLPVNIFVPPLETTSTTWTDSGLAVTLRDAVAGERVLVQLNGDFTATGGSGLYRIVVTDGAGTETELPESVVAMFPASGTQPRTVVALHTLGASGDVTVVSQFRCVSGSSTVQIAGPATLLSELVRF